MDLKKLMEGNQNLVLLIPNKHYPDALVEIARDLAERNESICYVSINKPSESIKKAFVKEGIDESKFYFIDCISRTITHKEEELDGKAKERTIFIDGPHSLTQLSLELFNIIEREKIEGILFDCISTLLIYNEEKDVMRFVHHMMSKIKKTNTKVIYPYLKEDTDSKIVKEMGLFADKIVEMGEKEIKKKASKKEPIKEEKIKKQRLDSFEEIIIK